MNQEILRADQRLRRFSLVVLTLATLLALVLVFAFQRWLAHTADAMPAAQLIAQLRRTIGAALTASGVCILLLAGYAARLARRILEQGRWPLAQTRVLRDTPIRRGSEAERIARTLNIAATALVLLAIIVAALSWHLFGQ
jgi:hypothetical protein